MKFVWVKEDISRSWRCETGSHKVTGPVAAGAELTRGAT